MGRDSSVGIETHYGLDHPGVESRWGRDFPHPSRLVLGPTQSPVQSVSRLSPGGKAVGAWRGVGHPPQSSAEVQERVELYLSPPLRLHVLLYGKLRLFILVYEL